MEEKPKDILDRIWNSDTLLIASTPVLSYTLIYAYHMGVDSVFNLPISFRDYSIGTILSFTLILITMLFAVSMYVDMFFRPVIRGEVSKSFQDVFRSHIIFYAFFLANLLLYIGLWKDFLIWVIAIITYSLRFLVAIFSRKYKGSFSEKIVASESERKYDEKPGLIGLAALRLGYKTTIFLLIMIALYIISYNIGRSFSLKETNFIVANYNQECVLMSFSDTTGVCYYFDRSKKTVSNIFRIIKIADDSTLIFKKQKIGPLTVEIIASLTPTPTKTPLPTLTTIPTEIPTVIPTITATP